METTEIEKKINEAIQLAHLTEKEISGLISHSYSNLSTNLQDTQLNEFTRLYEEISNFSLDLENNDKTSKLIILGEINKNFIQIKKLANVTINSHSAFFRSTTQKVHSKETSEIQSKLKIIREELNKLSPENLIENNNLQINPPALGR